MRFNQMGFCLTFIVLCVFCWAVPLLLLAGPEGDSGKFGYGKNYKIHANRFYRVKADVARCLKFMENLPVKNNIALIEPYELPAIQCLKYCRTKESAKRLVKLIGVGYMVHGGSKIIAVETVADDILVEIGLPSVDEILKGISDGRIKKKQYEACRRILSKILSKEGIQARIKFLKLENNKKLKAFMSWKSNSRK